MKLAGSISCLLVVMMMALVVSSTQESNNEQASDYGGSFPLTSRQNREGVLSEYREQRYPIHHHSRKRDSGNENDNTLRMTLILVFTIGITLTLLVSMTICAICMLHRARYGKFCCIKPKVRYQASLGFESECDNDEELEGFRPPQYDSSYLENESPPVYEDALQDVIITTGINTSTVILPPYPSSETVNTSASNPADPPQHSDNQHVIADTATEDISNVEGDRLDVVGSESSTLNCILSDNEQPLINQDYVDTTITV